MLPGKRFKNQNDIKHVIRRHAVHSGLLRWGCTCFKKFCKKVACFMLRHKKYRLVNKLLKTRACINYLKEFYIVLKGITRRCTNIPGNLISPHWSLHKKLCSKCLLYLNRNNCLFLDVFADHEVVSYNLVVDHNDIIKEFIVELHEYMLKVWRQCAALCYNFDYRFIETRYPFFSEYSCRLDYYLSVHFDRVRREHHTLDIFMQQTLQVCKLDKKCDCVENYMKVIISILIDGHVDNVMGFLNPKECYITQMWRYYKMYQRLYNEKIKYEHEENDCYYCNIYLENHSYQFCLAIKCTPDRGDIFRLQVLNLYLQKIWANCPLHCIKEFSEPRENDEEYSLTIHQIYHTQRLFVDGEVVVD